MMTYDSAKISRNDWIHVYFFFHIFNLFPRKELAPIWYRDFLEGLTTELLYVAIYHTMFLTTLIVAISNGGITPGSLRADLVFTSLAFMAALRDCLLDHLFAKVPYILEGFISVRRVLVRLYYEHSLK